MKTTIRKKILLFSAALMVCICVVQLIFGLFFSRSFLIYVRKKEMTDLFSRIRSGYTDDVYDLGGIVEQGESMSNIRVTVFDGENMVYSSRFTGSGFLYFEPPVPDAASRPPERKETPDFSGFSEKPKVQTIRDDKQENLILQGKLQTDDGERYVTLWSSVDAIEQNVRKVAMVNACISIGVLLIGSVISFFVAKSISRPIREIESVSKKIALLDFSQAADENANTTELASLARSVNSMSEKLRDTIDRLQSANAELAADIDYRKQAEKMQREWIANVSHEMKTPLYLLQMYSENLKNNIDGIDREYYCRTIVDETQRLDDLVKSMLELSSLENGLYHLQLQRVDLSELCSAVLGKTEILMRGIDYRAEIEPDVIVTADAKYLEQAIGNYLSNAVSHTEKGRQIRVSLHTRDGNAVFRVYNEGLPIDEKKLPHIWESFYKTDEARVRTESAHAGLGLYIVKTIIEKHHGECEARNTEDGVEFLFRLPL